MKQKRKRKINEDNLKANKYFKKWNKYKYWTINLHFKHKLCEGWKEWKRHSKLQRKGERKWEWTR